MLGNWSFGDYFKRDSLKWAWELLTQVYQLPADKLWATVYIDDDEAYDIWTKEIGLPAERVVRIGDNKGAKYASDNFWMMADTGPCGPCSEIFYDHGPEVAGGPPGSPDADGDRYIEIWNNVFMQFDMQPDGSVKPLPAPCVDTGMGLERLAAILQHKHSNYEIDLFDTLIRAAARETGCTDLAHNSLKVIADHIRATAFLVSDGVIPSNEGRGYVQRRIVRRAIRHGYKLGKKTPFFHKLVADLVQVMGEAYPAMAASSSASPRCSRPRRNASSRPWKSACRSSTRRSWVVSPSCRATWPSSCTTPSGSRSTCRPTCAASAVSRSTKPASMPPWTARRPRPVRLANSRWTRPWSTPARATPSWGTSS